MEAICIYTYINTHIYVYIYVIIIYIYELDSEFIFHHLPYFMVRIITNLKSDSQGGSIESSKIGIAN